MLNKLKKTDNKGFTIIEVMIVLAIAGLILLIVFLAVPALQRSARNTQRKTDVGRVGSAAQDVISNNNGSLAALTSANLQAQLGAAGTSLAYYPVGNITVSASAPAAAGSHAPDFSHVVVYAQYAGVGSTCSTTTLGDAIPGSNPNQIAITYATETGSGTSFVCASE